MIIIWLFENVRVQMAAMDVRAYGHRAASKQENLRLASRRCAGFPTLYIRVEKGWIVG